MVEPDGSALHGYDFIFIETEKKMKKLLFTAVLFLTACEVEFEVPVNLSDINSDKIIERSANMMVQVPTCNDYEDSRKESDTLVQIKNEMVKALPIAKYKECFTKEMYSWAVFNLPAAIIPEKNSEQAAIDGVYQNTPVTITILETEDKGVKSSALVMQIPGFIKKDLKKFAEDNYTDLDISIRQNVTNDLKKNYSVGGLSAYLFGKPYYPEFTVNVSPEKTLEIRLPNVAADHLTDIDTKDSQWTLFVEPGKEQKPDVN